MRDWKRRTIDREGLESSSFISASSASFMASSVPPELRIFDSEFVSADSIFDERWHTHDESALLKLCMGLADRICLSVWTNALGA